MLKKPSKGVCVWCARRALRALPLPLHIPPQHEHQQSAAVLAPSLAPQLGGHCICQTYGNTRALTLY